MILRRKIPRHHRPKRGRRKPGLVARPTSIDGGHPLGPQSGNFGASLMAVWRLGPSRLVQSPGKRCGETTFVDMEDCYLIETAKAWR